MMPGGGSQSQGMNQSQGVFGLPANSTFPQFGQRATTPSQGNTRFGFGGGQAAGAPSGWQAPQPSGPFHGGMGNQVRPQMVEPSNPFSYNMQTPQNTQGLNQGQVNAGVYTRPDGTISFSGGPASPMSSLTAGFLGGGRPQQNFQQNSFGPPAPSYPGGQTEGFGPSPPSFGGQAPFGSFGSLPSDSAPGVPPSFGQGAMPGQPMTGLTPNNQSPAFDPWARSREMAGQPAGGFSPSSPMNGGFDPWAASRAMAGQLQSKPTMIQAPQTAPASPFPASQAPQFDMFGRATVGNRNPFAR